MSDDVHLTVDGAPVRVPAGCSVAAAILSTGALRLRSSISGSPRGPLCGMGVCFECRVTINGLGGQRSCMVTCRDNMKVSTG